MGEPLEPVIVGVDGSVESMSALDLAAEEAAGRVAPLVVVHVGDAHPAGRLLAAAVSRASAEHPALSVTAELHSGEPGETLVDRAREARLLVVGHRARCAGRSVAHQVVGRSAVPVIVDRPLYPMSIAKPPRPVLVGVACAPGDDAVVEFAFEEASLRGAPLRAEHIWRGDAPGRDEADQMLVDALRAWSEKYPDVVVRRMIRRGLDVPVSLTAASRSAQLVVVGGARRPGVAQILAHRAGCSVAVVPVTG
jgi:nucleotide-binding universal stress UspA family protein